jgi:hypothetical protein
MYIVGRQWPSSRAISSNNTTIKSSTTHSNRLSPKPKVLKLHQQQHQFIQNMGLLGTGIKYGAVFVAAREGMKHYEKRSQRKHNEQQQVQGTRSIESAPYPGPPEQQQYQQPLAYEQPANVSGSFHQVWCKGNCGGKCIPPETWRSLGLDVPAPQYNEKTPAY